MWSRTYSQVYQGLKKEAVWKKWTDINNWPSWHDDLEYCELKGDFVEGNSFKLKPKGAPAVKIKLLEIKEGHKFTDCTSFPGAKMYDTHEMLETTEGLKLTNTLLVTGFLKYLWIYLVAKKVAETVPQELDSLAKLVRSADA